MTDTMTLGVVANDTLKPAVDFLDIYGIPFSLPLEDCDSLDVSSDLPSLHSPNIKVQSTRGLIATNLGLDGNEINFFVGNRMIPSSTWSEVVKPGVTVALRYSPRRSLTIPLPPLALPPPPPPPLPPPPPYPDPDVPCLKASEILEAQGHYKLPFPDCEGRIVTFVQDTRDWDPSREYRKVTNAPPERWCDLAGNVITRGEASTSDQQRIVIGPSLLAQYKKRVRYVLIRKSTLKVTSRDGSPHVNGDSIYQWVSCPTLEHVKEALVETCAKEGWSIVGSWAKKDMQRFGCLW